MTFVHVNAADADLAEEWLRATPNRLFGGGAPVILSDEEDAPIAAGIARRHGLAHHAIPDAPDRPEARVMPPCSATISSCAALPRLRARSKPSPTSTPLIAWIPISAAASWASSRRSQWTCEPRPGGSPQTTTSTTPPSVSPSFWAASTSATMAALVAGSKQRTGSVSIAARSSGPASIRAQGSA